jgi:UDP-3-O-[3-hydroxymyristoyl] glucosamine N-acyltransferase
MKLKDIAERIGAKISGKGSLEIKGVASLGGASEGHISFASGQDYALAAKNSKASALIVPEEQKGLAAGKPALLVPDAYRAFITVEELFVSKERPVPGIHKSVVKAEDADVAEDASIGPLVAIAPGAKVGSKTSIGAGCYIGRDVEIGSECILYPNVTLLDRVKLGDRVVIHSGTVIGSDGFGYLLGEKGHQKIPQIGTVIIEDDVEIGASCAIDRASLDATIIGKGTKLDNLVHIAHSVIIGPRCIILAGTIIGGSVTIGEGTMISGGVAIKDHVNIGSAVRVVGRSSVMNDIRDGQTVAGTMLAQPFSKAKRTMSRLKQLPDLFTRVRKLEDEVFGKKEKSRE